MTTMVEYYAARAAEYEKLYEKPERQADLTRMAALLKEMFRDLDVLEIACGTGWWTQQMAQTARSVLATDINEPMLALARAKGYPRGNVTFRRDDLYHTTVHERFDGLFGGFIWSHVPLENLGAFVAQAARWLRPGGTLAFADNRFVSDSNTPVSHYDAAGNAFQTRRLLSGAEYSVLKNFPTPAFLKKALQPVCAEVEVVELEYYWLCRCQPGLGQKSFT